MEFLPSLDILTGFLNLDPLIRGLQIALGVFSALLIFLVFWTTRDIVRRSRSLFVQLSCILLVAALPIVGFFLYLLLRPRRTIEEKEMEIGRAHV